MPPGGRTSFLLIAWTLWGSQGCVPEFPDASRDASNAISDETNHTTDTGTSQDPTDADSGNRGDDSAADDAQHVDGKLDLLMADEQGTNDLVSDVPPHDLSYSTNPAVYTRGNAITPNTPSSDGGVVLSYSVSPPLPAGLNLGTSSGVISGTPLQISAETEYTITAANGAGSTTAVLSIKVNDMPPSDLTYAQNPAVYTKGLAIIPNTPSSTGGAVTTYAMMASSLPPGLSLGESTGIISGVPTSLTPATSCMIAASNTGGSTTTTLAIKVVDDVPPSELIYSTNPAVYTRGIAITPNTPSNNGGVVLSYSVSPPLPAGLTCSNATGVISGTPKALSPATDYVVTAMNSRGSTTATLMIAVNGIEAVVAGSHHTCVLANGGVQCWGQNGVGELGNGSTADSYLAVAVSGLSSGVQAIALQTSHACAIAEGAAWCWGSNSWGQLGNDSDTRSAVPVEVLGLSSGVRAIDTGDFFSCALVINGVQCWGRNEQGQLGNNSTTASHVPVAVFGLSSDVQDVAAGWSHACALMMNGSVQCWGLNQTGQLGNGTTSWSNPLPMAVPSLSSGVQAVSAGESHTCAIVNGGAWCWGYNIYGQVGNGSTSWSTNVPVAVSGLSSGVQTIEAGDHHTCAVVNGAAWCWGCNSHGQLGNDSTTDTSWPVVVSGLSTGVLAIAAGEAHSCALVGGEVKCWGSNDYGQLGNGSTTDSHVPVSISSWAEREVDDEQR